MSNPVNGAAGSTSKSSAKTKTPGKKRAKAKQRKSKRDARASDDEDKDEDEEEADNGDDGEDDDSEREVDEDYDEEADKKYTLPAAAAAKPEKGATNDSTTKSDASGGGGDDDDEAEDEEDEEEDAEPLDPDCLERMAKEWLFRARSDILFPPATIFEQIKFFLAAPLEQASRRQSHWTFTHIATRSTLHLAGWCRRRGDTACGTKARCCSWCRCSL
jgi:hypothetical protein